MAKQRSYSEVLKKLETPVDLDKVRVCKLCGELMHWQEINRHVGFWIHKDEAIKKCAEANPLMKGKPVIAQNMQFYTKTRDLWKEMVEVLNARQNPRKRQNMHKL